MVIFLAYAAEHLEMADQAKLALAGAAYRAFFERGSLLAGANYHVRIRELKGAASNSTNIVSLSSFFL